MVKHSDRRIHKELQDLMQDPINGIVVDADEDNLHVWEVTISGPPGSIYQGEDIKVKVIFPRHFPYRPPRILFITELFHPNVNLSGELAMTLLKMPADPHVVGDNWGVLKRIRTVLENLLTLLTVPDSLCITNTEAAEMINTDPATYEAINKTLLHQGQEEEEEEEEEDKEEEKEKE